MQRPDTDISDFSRPDFPKANTSGCSVCRPTCLRHGGARALLDRAIRLGTRLLTYALFSLLALRVVREIANRLHDAGYERRWPTVDAAFLVPLWAAIALAFHFAIALPDPRYATSVVVFAWPALVAEIDRRRQAVIWLGLMRVLRGVSPDVRTVPSRSRQDPTEHRS